MDANDYVGDEGARVGSAGSEPVISLAQLVESLFSALPECRGLDPSPARTASGPLGGSGSREAEDDACY
jgi:hypothetical protein